MSVRSRCLASLLALLAAAGCATSAPELPAAYAPSSASGPAPAEEPALDLEEQYRTIQAALDAEGWAEVIERSLAYLKATKRPQNQWRVTAVIAWASFFLRRWEECVGLSRKCLDWAAESPSVDAPLDWILNLVLIEAESLLALDRAAEAEVRLDEGVVRAPGLREKARWRFLRLAARSGDGVLFDFPPVAPSEAHALQKGQRRLEQAIPAAMEHIRQRLDAPDLPFPPIRVSVVDGSEPAEGDYLARATVAARGSGWIGVIRIRLEAVLHPTQQDERLLAHELTHVVHLAGTATRELPSWLTEGIAHWVETADDLTHREMVLERAMRPDGSSEASVGELLEDEAAIEAADDRSRRVCGAVVFFHLERKLGTTVVQRLIRRLLKEGDWAAVLREETRLDMPRLWEDVHSGYIEWATATFPEPTELLEASRLGREGKFREAVEAVDSYLVSAADDSIRWYAEVMRLHLLVTLEDWPAARAALAPIHALRRTRPLAGPVGRGFMCEVEVLRGSGDWAGLAALAREARNSLWVWDQERRAELDEALAEAEKHLAEAAPPK